MTVVDTENNVSDERTPLLSESSSETVTPEEPILNKPSKTDLYWILVALWTAVFLGALDGTIVATLLTSIGSYFDKAHMASHLGTAYLLSVCCFTPLYGRLSDILGRKGAMLLALSLFGIGTALCGIAPSMETLIAARAIAGMGGGGVMTVSSITVTDIIPLKRRGVYQGLTNILFGVGAGLGGPLGGYINDHIGWRWAFLAQIPILLLACVLVAWKVNVHLPNSSRTVKEKLARIDYFGSLTLLLTVSSLLLGVTFKANEEKPWGSLLVWPFFLIFVLSAIAFILVEAKYAAEPIMPLRLLEERTPLCLALANFTLSIVAFSVLYNVPIYFSAVRLQSSTDAGLHLLPNSFALAIGSVTSGVIMRATGKYYYLTLASAALAILASVSMALWNDNSGQFTLWMAITPSGFGLASLLTSSLIALISSVSREDFAVATGISYLFRTTGQVLSVSINGSVLQAVLQSSLRKRIHGPDAHEIIQTIRHSTTIIRHLDPEIREAAVESYALALKAVFILQTAAAIITFLLCLPIQENPLPGSHEEQAEHDRLRRERQAQRSR